MNSMSSVVSDVRVDSVASPDQQSVSAPRGQEQRRAPETTASPPSRFPSLPPSIGASAGDSALASPSLPRRRPSLFVLLACHCPQLSNPVSKETVHLPSGHQRERVTASAFTFQSRGSSTHRLDVARSLVTELTTHREALARAEGIKAREARLRRLVSTR